MNMTYVEDRERYVTHIIRTIGTLEEMDVWLESLIRYYDENKIKSKRDVEETIPAIHNLRDSIRKIENEYRHMFDWVYDL